MIRIATRSSALAIARRGRSPRCWAERSWSRSPPTASRRQGAVRARGRAGAARRRGGHRGALGQGPAGGDAEGLAIAAVPAREDPADVWIGVGALARRRARRAPGSAPRACAAAPSCSPPGPTCEVSELHGNVDTRLRKLAEGELDAIVLAAAGLRRLGREDEASFALPAEAMTPAAGQGALVLQARRGRCRRAERRGGDRRRDGAARADRRARRRRPARRDLRDARSASTPSDCRRR